jgi:hypothetical protein
MCRPAPRESGKDQEAAVGERAQGLDGERSGEASKAERRLSRLTPHAFFTERFADFAM